MTDSTAGMTPEEARRADEAHTGPMLAADGTPLKKSLARALRRQKLRALGLIAPLLVFVLITFVVPIGDMLLRSIKNDIVADTLPATVETLADWDADASELPGDDVWMAFYVDMWFAAERKEHTRLGSRLNYEQTGVSSLFRKTGRRVDRFDTDVYTDQLVDLDPSWEDPASWAAMLDGPAADALPLTAETWERWKEFNVEEGDAVLEEDVPDFLFTTLYYELNNGAEVDGMSDRLDAAKAAVGEFETVSLQEQFADADEDWLDPEVWKTIQLYSPRVTSGYFANSVDMQLTPEGIEPRPDNQQIYGILFKRTLFMSLVITGSCIMLAYPVAWLLSNLPMRTANLLMILVLLPFWTSLLVRTSAWKVMLQQQGVINDVLVWLGLVADDARLTMINNQFGTIVAMTHILLPFMILPMYSVMSTIPPSYLRAAKSLGATNWTAFWRVYFPQSVPGIGAGSILVFILAIGYYITPEIVGGNTGTFISNRIAYHISSSLNWGLAAALGTILLVVVLVLYWAYDKIVGIDNVKLG
ncbi:ABC transporter permease [Pseudooceanicola atlanticus]|uniref:Polyamine ABC transporter permease n=1 Tax=Pseudooceanicola atlanticus TaxID=1461694 RepID=A0A0A0EI00_9RHOB|nr:ABC transporter permease [Pseudooceanicola atlanticus]KGM50029.1 polyamine ABC transporter permease [Pseudooceanicola atlanticus]